MFELNENLKEIMVKKGPKYLRKHASQRDVGKNGEKNHHPICS